MKALTVRQPHAQLIILGPKRIETRGWATKYRGPLVIHAGLETPDLMVLGDWHIMPDKLTGPKRSRNYFACNQRDGGEEPLPLGAIIGSCNLVDDVPIVDPSNGDPGGALIVVDGEGGAWHHCDRNPIDGDDLSAQLPYGDFTPGRRAWLLEDVEPVEKRCPACWGHKRGPLLAWSSQMGDMYHSCSVCKGKGRTDPIPVKGRQGLWTWEPGAA